MKDDLGGAARRRRPDDPAPDALHAREELLDLRVLPLRFLASLFPLLRPLLPRELPLVGPFGRGSLLTHRPDRASPPPRHPVPDQRASPEALDLPYGDPLVHRPLSRQCPAPHLLDRHRRLPPHVAIAPRPRDNLGSATRPRHPVASLPQQGLALVQRGVLTLDALRTIVVEQIIIPTIQVILSAVVEQTHSSAETESSSDTPKSAPGNKPPAAVSRRNGGAAWMSSPNYALTRTSAVSFAVGPSPPERARSPLCLSPA